MCAIEERHYRINRILLLIIGVWPYERSTFAKVQKLLVSVILTSVLCNQLMLFITREFTTALLIEDLSYVFPTCVVAIKYYYFYIKTGAVKRLFECIQADWDSLKDEHERKIIESYTESGKLITTVTILFCCSVVFIYVTSPITTYIISIYLSYNGTHWQRMYIPLEYSIDQEKYFYAVVLHFISFLLVGSISVVATATLLALYMKHACGLLKIARFTDRVMSTFTVMYLLIIMMGVATVILFAYRLLHTFKTTRDWREAFVMVVIISGNLIYMFFANNAAQEVSDHSSNVFLSAYKSTWYVAPLRIQKLILFLLQYGARNYNIIIGGVFISSLEGFATLLSTSLSYFMVLYSTQTTGGRMQE